MNRLHGVVWAVAGLGVGLFIGYFSGQLHTLELEKKVDLGDLFNFISTVVIALLIGNFIQQRYTNLRVEKDLLIGDIKEIIGYAKDVRGIFVESFNRQEITADDSKAIKALLRNIANSLSMLEKSLSDCKKSVGDLKVDTIKSQYLEYKAALTGGSFPSKPYSGETFSEEESLYIDMHSKLQSLIFQINRR